MAHGRCMLDKKDYTRTWLCTRVPPHSHTHKYTEIFHAYCFSTATVFSRTRLNVSIPTWPAEVNHSALEYAFTSRIQWFVLATFIYTILPEGLYRFSASSAVQCSITDTGVIRTVSACQCCIQSIYFNSL